MNIGYVPLHRPPDMVSAGPLHIGAVPGKIGGEHRFKGSDRLTAGILLIPAAVDPAQTCIGIEKGAGVTEVVDYGVSPNMLLAAAAAAFQTDAVPLLLKDFPAFSNPLPYSHRISSAAS